MIGMMAAWLLGTLSLQVATALPGDTYARPEAGTVLHAGPDENAPGVLTLDGETTLRVGAERGVWREVLSPSQQKAFEMRFGDIVRNYGYADL